VIVAASVVACSLLTPLDGLSGDAGSDGVAPPGDSGFDAAETTPTDGGASCGTLDGSVAFCDDFDDIDANVYPKWTKVVANGGGTVARVASDASAPFGVQFTVPTTDGGATQADIQRVLGSGPKTLARYTYHLRVVQYPTTGSFNISPVALSGSGMGVLDAIALRSGGQPNFVEQIPTDGGGSTTIPHALTSTPAPGAWVRVRIDWVIAGTITAQVFFDDVPVTTPITLDPSSAFNSSPSVTAGITFEALTANGASVEIDDVVFEML
jgi:hypothetical protein